MEPVRVLIVDDHTLFREGVLAILGGAADVEVVGEAATGQEAVEQAAKEFNRKSEFLSGVRVAKYSPRFSKVRIDVRIY